MSSTILYLFLILSFVSMVSSLRCAQCNKMVRCPRLPKNRECFKARAPCACCDKCAGRLGDECGALKIRCHPDYVCENRDGVQRSIVPWHMLRFRGTCKPAQRRKYVRTLRR